MTEIKPIKDIKVTENFECSICLSNVDKTKISKVDKSCKCVYNVCTLCALKNIQHEIFSKCFLCKKEINLSKTYHNITGEKYNGKAVLQNVDGKIYATSHAGPNVIAILTEFIDIQKELEEEESNVPQNNQSRGQYYTRQSHMDMESMLREPSGNFNFDLDDFCSYLHSIGCNLDNYLPEHFIENNLMQLNKEILRQETELVERNNELNRLRELNNNTRNVEVVNNNRSHGNVFSRFFSSLFK